MVVRSGALKAVSLGTRTDGERGRASDLLCSLSELAFSLSRAETYGSVSCALGSPKIGGRHLEHPRYRLTASFKRIAFALLVR